MSGTAVKPVIVAAGIYVPGYGLTRVFEELFARLSNDFTIHWLGIAWRGDVTVTAHYTLYPSNLRGGDMYGAAEAAEMAIEHNAAVLWLLNDMYMLRNYSHTWKKLKGSNILLAGYIPLDGDITDENIIADALFLDRLILYSEWAKEQTGNAISRYLRTHTGLQPPQTEYIYHGVDTSFFTPADEAARQLKEKLFDVPDAGNAIFILNANRYNPRKDIECTLSGFAKALPHFTRPVYLCLHTPGVAIDALAALGEKIQQSPAAEAVLFNPLGPGYCSNETLRELYRACEIGVNTSVGEGWGLISFEHAACGGAQIVPAHSSPAVVWGNGALQLPVKKEVSLDTNPFKMYAVDDNILAAQLTELVNNESSMKELRKNSYNWSRSDQFSWDSIATRWKQLFLDGMN